MNVVATCLLTKMDNPLCPGCDNYRPDLAMLKDWLGSLRDCMAVVVHDELAPAEQARATGMARVPVQFVQVDSTEENVYFQRWQHLADWLHDEHGLEYLWITDGSDVRMLNSPWEYMDPGRLYLGSEDGHTVSLPWILNNHPSLRPFAAEHPHHLLLNAGILGGHRLMVLSFIDLLLRREPGGDLTDMAAFNLTAYQDWPHFITGHPVHTKFNAWAASDPVAFFAHK